jgi:transcriptional repressor NrdR
LAAKKSSGDKKGTTRKITRHAINANTKNKKTDGATINKRNNKKVAVNIRRSSGRKEKFNVDRMAQTSSRSGVPFMMARDISKNVSKKISSEAKRSKKEEKTVSAARVRKMISEELRDRNEQAKASSYTGEVPENALREYSTVKIGGQYASPIGSADTHQHEAYRADADSVMHDKSKRHQSST